MGSLGDRLVAYRLFVILVLDILVSDFLVSPRIDALELCKVFAVSAIGSSEEVKFKVYLSQLIINVPVIILAKAWGQGGLREILLFTKRMKFFFNLSQRIKGVLFPDSCWKISTCTMP